MFRPLLPALLVAISVAAVSAQSRTITARTLCFSHVDEIKDVWIPVGKERSMTEIGLFTAVHSLPFEMATTEGRAVFFRPSESDGTPFEPLASAPVPDSSEVLFLFIPSGDPERPYRVVSLADDERNFPYGAVRLMNLSNYQVRVHMGEHNGPKAVDLDPGKSELIREVTRLDDFNRYPVLAEYRTDRGFARFHHTAWRSVRGKRDLSIIFTDPASGRPKIRHYEDAKPAELDDEP